MKLATERSCQGLSSSRPYGRVVGSTLLAVVFSLVAGLGGVTPCLAAGLVIVAPNLIVTPGSSGSFDVLLINNGSASPDIASDSLQLVLSGSAGNAIQFTNATINTVSDPYLFTHSLSADFGIPFVSNTLPATQLITSDSGDPVSGYPGFTTVNPGTTFGLANVSYSVSPTVQGSDAITFVLSNGATSLADPTGLPIAFTTQDGSIGTASIPEPSTLALGSIAASLGLGTFWWRRRGNRQRRSA